MRRESSDVRVLVTGGAGYVGSRLTAHLLASGHDVTVFDALIYGGEALLPFAGMPSFRLVKGDVRDRAALESSMHNKDAVVHLAAMVGEQACDLEKAAAEQINHLAAVAALEIAHSRKVPRFVFISTCSNYGVSDPETPADENSELRPLSLYARTKIDAEHRILEYRGETVPIVLRLGTICGLSARMRFDLLVNDMARAAALSRKIEIYKPKAWRPFLHIADAGRVVEYVLGSEAERVANRVFNVVGENYRKQTLVDVALKHFPNVNISMTDGRPDDRDYRVSGARIEGELGFAPLHTVEEAFVETAQAVADGVFVDPFWAGHSAVPPARQPLLNV